MACVRSTAGTQVVLEEYLAHVGWIDGGVECPVAGRYGKLHKEGLTWKHPAQLRWGRRGPGCTSPKTPASG